MWKDDLALPGRDQCIHRIGSWAALGMLLLLAPSLAAQVVETQAAISRPFGVAAVSFRSSGEGDETAWLGIEERNGRARYPVFASGIVSRLLGDAVEVPAESGTRTVLFLFTGSDPLELTLRTPAPVAVSVRPATVPPRQFERLLGRWWREYHGTVAELSRSGDYPPLLETYLTGMLGQRLGLGTPLLTQLVETTQQKSPAQETFELLLSTEKLHVETVKETMSGTRPLLPTDQPLPPETDWTPLRLAVGAGVEVEPIARHVPVECFYVRFGSFDNYLWLEELMTSHGGDIGRMITARGQDAQLSERQRRQLATPASALAKIFGGQLIGDVALIGRDMYMQDGAAIGVLFHARNSGALSLSFQQQRAAAARDERKWGATLETVRIADRDVSLLSTPDNQLRSFYAVDGDFHLVTSSRRIAERFFEAGQGRGSLGESSEFQFARTQMPISRNDTVFAFLSTAFFQSLLGPHYQIELARRLEALTDLELVQMAKLAAAAEGTPQETIEGLIEYGFLPRGFGLHADGSGPILENRRAIDSLRGARGTFLPIPDVPIDSATSAEVAAYQAQAGALAQQWRQLDPIMVGIQRATLPGQPIDRLSIDANISPLSEEKYGRVMSILGPPVQQRVRPRDTDVMSMEAYVTGGQLSSVIRPHLLFVGVQDTQPSIDLDTKGFLQMLRLLRTTPGYLGAWPKPGFLDWLPLRAPVAPVDGFTRLLFDVWRWQGADYSLVSFHRNVLESTIPQLEIIDTDQPAQIRVHVKDLSASQLRDWINGMFYQRAWESSVANVRLFQALIQQLRIPPEESMAKAEELFNTKFVCPLGGEYKYEVPAAGREPLWHSTAWSTTGAIPDSYVAPILQWFRGLELSLIKSGDQLSVHTEVDMEALVSKPTTPAPSLFDFFKKKE